jgi:hypothetical protein
LSRLTGVQSKRIKDQLEIEVMITATLPVSQSSCPYRNRKAYCLARHDFPEKAWSWRNLGRSDFALAFDEFEQCVDHAI